MKIPQTYFLRDLGPQAQMMARNRGNDRLGLILQYVALGSTIVMTGLAGMELLRDAFGDRDRDHGHGRPRYRNQHRSADESFFPSSLFVSGACNRLPWL